ncbi:MAG: MBL fold metallo-hydrolase [Candidatus Hadarchaeia archaeon]
MNFKVVYDNRAKAGFREGWGFSCLIELEKENILFDTGWDGKILLSNMSKMNVKLDDIDRVVLSHAHWDHIGGLTHVLREGMKVYLPQSFSEHLKDELRPRTDLHVIDDPQEIMKGVWSTGELENKIEEQSLVLETSKGLVVVVGCSHPGVPKILSVSSKFGDLYGIIGGLHGFDQYEVLEGLGLIVATHCTENDDKIEELFQESYVEGGAGLEISLE